MAFWLALVVAPTTLSLALWDVPKLRCDTSRQCSPSALSIGVPSVDGRGACCDACLAEPNCYGFTWNHSSNRCALKTEDHYLTTKCDPYRDPHCLECGLAPRQDPVVIDFKGDAYEVQPYQGPRPSDDVFMPGDTFQLNGTVHASGGTVTAKKISGNGTSPDHVIIFRTIFCDLYDQPPEFCEWMLTILVDGHRTYEGQSKFIPGYLELSYAKSDVEYATLAKYEPPIYCGDALPTFKSALFALRLYPGSSDFSNGDVFSLDGVVDNTSGHVTAKRISGKGPDHQLIFGNSTCCRNMFSMSGVKRRWPLTIVVNGKNTKGYAEFRPTDGFVIMQYSDENAELGGEGPHYERPSGGFPCQPGEAFGRVADGMVCAPPCSDNSCPRDVAKGVTAMPTCGALRDPSGNKYCALRCQGDDECGRDPYAKCAHPEGGPGICVFGNQPKPPADSSNSIFFFPGFDVIV